MFQRNQKTGKTELKPSLLGKLTLFNNLKKWVQSFADEETEMIDLGFLQRILVQYKQKVRCYFIG